ncbi:hypothetical protein L0F63_007137, partial [Massospora cicadina]
DYEVVQAVSPEQRKEAKKARKAAEKVKEKKQKEEKEEANREEASKRNIEQQHEHLSSMTEPKTAQPPQEYAQWASNQKVTTHTS